MNPKVLLRIKVKELVEGKERNICRKIDKIIQGVLFVRVIKPILINKRNGITSPNFFLQYDGPEGLNRLHRGASRKVPQTIVKCHNFFPKILQKGNLYKRCLP